MGSQNTDIEDGRRDGPTGAERVQLRELKKHNRLLEQENEVLRRAAAYLSQANLPGKQSSRSSMRWPRLAPRSGCLVTVACRALGLPTEGCYERSTERLCQQDDAHTINALQEIHNDAPTLGYRFLTLRRSEPSVRTHAKDSGKTFTLLLGKHPFNKLKGVHDPWLTINREPVVRAGRSKS